MGLADRIGRALMALTPESTKVDEFWRIAERNPDRLNAITGNTNDAAVSMEFDSILAREDEVRAKHKAEFPWLFDPPRGARWDFDPVLLRNLGQEALWVGMMVQSITKELAGMEWDIVEVPDGQARRQRLSRSHDDRPFARRADSPAADELRALLNAPNKEHTYDDWLRMSVADALEVGSMAGVKVFDERHYEEDELTTDPALIRPMAVQPTAPEVWTKGYDKFGELDAFYQFDRVRMPGSGASGRGARSARGAAKTIRFAEAEVAWLDHAPRTNRRYGLPPALLVKSFLQLMDLTTIQEMQYYERGSLPAGAFVGEEWDREDAEEFLENLESNVKGKPHKLVVMWGKGRDAQEGGDVRFEPMSFTLDEMQFMERMQWYARAISAAFQVPTAVVGIEPEKINYATFEGERENFRSNTLGPYARMWERYVNGHIVQPHAFDGLMFEVQPAMSESAKQDVSDRVTREFSLGLKTRNEARRKLGDPEVDDERDGFVDELGIEGVDTGNEQTAQVEATDGRVVDVGISRSEPMREVGPDAGIFTIQPRHVDALQEELAKHIDDLVGRLLRDPQLRSEVSDLAEDDETSPMFRSRAGLRALVTERIVDSGIGAVIGELVQDHAEEAITVAIEQAERETGEEVIAEDVAARVRDRDVRFADDFAERMAVDIRDTVARGWEDGKSTDAIMEDLVEKQSEFTEWGAERIARQELQVASGEARNEVARQLGRVEVWLHSGDYPQRDGARQTHDWMDGRWKRADEEWEVPYDRFGEGSRRAESVPGDSVDGIGCRCRTLLMQRDEVDDGLHQGA